MRSRIALLAVFAFFICAIGVAQVRSGTIEISPFAGYLFGGDFPRGSNALFASRVDVDDHATYGAGLGYFISSKAELEVRWARTETHFLNHASDQVFGGPRQQLADLTIDYVLGYGTFHFGHRRAVPYVTFGLGAARLDPGPLTVACIVAPCPVLEPTTSTRFTAAAGGGVKIYVNRNFGFRLDGRYYGTYLNSNDRCGTFSDHRTFCSNDRTNWLGNTEATGGLLLSF